MRQIYLVAATLLAVGCASEPAAPPVPAPVAPAVAAAPATPPPAAAAPAAAPAAAAARPLSVQQARAAGYRIVNENGRTLYCREDRKTGSHIRTEMVCLTPEELEVVREANKRNLEQMQRAIPPKQGG